MITENNDKYLVAPSIELIDSVVKQFKVTEAQFERFFGIPKGTIKVIRFGQRDLPSKFWHLFYDPQYDKVMRVDRVKKAVSSPVTISVTKNNSNISKSDTKPDPKLQKLLSK